MPDVEPLTAEEILVVRHLIAYRKRIILGILTAIGLGIGGVILSTLAGIS